MMVQTGVSYFQFRQDPRYKVVTRPEELEQMVRFLATQKRMAFDYETSGTRWWQGSFSAGLAFTSRDPAEDRPRNYYVPFRHLTGQAQLAPEIVFSAIKPLFEDPRIEKIAHHIKFDQHFLHKDGLRIVGPRHDTMIAAHLYDENTPKGLKVRALADLGDPDAHLHEQMLSTELTRLAKHAGLSKTAYLDQYGYAGLDIWLSGAYAAHDTEMTWGLLEFYEKERVLSFYRRIYATEMALTEILVDMEEVGVQLDVEYLQKLHGHLQKEKEKAEGVFFQQSGVEWFNLGSDDLLRDFLKRKLKLPLTKMTKGGAFSVDVEVLNHFAKAQPFLAHVARWRDVEKKLSTYTLNLIDLCDSNGVLHGDFKQVGTNCLPRGELVLTNRGYLPIEDVQVGDTVLTHRQRARRVVDVLNNGVQDIVEVSTCSGNVLRTTANHQYQLEDGSWLEASKLTLGQQIVVHSRAEEWRGILRWPDYEVSSWGRVRHWLTKRICKLFSKGRLGHLKVALSRDETQPVDRLVASTFGVPGIGPEVCHLNGIAWDNSVANLRWESQQKVELRALPRTVVKSIRVLSPEPTIGLAVREDHSHVTGGLVTHNTGRLSCEKPNLQNIPSDDDGRAEANGGLDPESIKRAFVIQRKIDPIWGGRKKYRIFADYSQIELRVLARYSSDERLVAAYRHNGDIHDETEMAVFGTKGKNRRLAKVINFGLCLDGFCFVLTQQNGYVHLKDVRPEHMLWDGIEWVHHEGLVCRGDQEVISYQRIAATPEHEVFIRDGRRMPLCCAQQLGLRIASGEVEGVLQRYVTRFDETWSPENTTRCGSCPWCLSAKSGSRVERPAMREVKVYDLLNAGPRHRFTVNGRVVSNSYMMSPLGFARQTGETEEASRAYFDEFNSKFPGVKAYRDHFFAQVRLRGGHFQNLWGRTRRVPMINSDRAPERTRAERQAIASLIQGTAAELTKETLVRVWNRLKSGGMESRLVQTVHDEIQIDGPVEEFAVVAREVKRLAEDYSAEFGEVPIVMEVEVSTKSWAKSHKQKVTGLNRPEGS